MRHDRSTAYKDHRLSEMVSQIQVTPAASQGSLSGIGYPGATGPAQSGVTVSLGNLLGQHKPTASRCAINPLRPSILSIKTCQFALSGVRLVLVLALGISTHHQQPCRLFCKARTSHRIGSGDTAYI